MEKSCYACLLAGRYISFSRSFKEQLKDFFSINFSFQVHHQSVIHFRKCFCWVCVLVFHWFLLNVTPLYYIFLQQSWYCAKNNGLCAEGSTYISSVSHFPQPLPYLITYKSRNTLLPQKKPYQSGIELNNGNKEKNIYLCCDICPKLIHEIFKGTSKFSPTFSYSSFTLSVDKPSCTTCRSIQN